MKIRLKISEIIIRDYVNNLELYLVYAYFIRNPFNYK